MANRLAECRSPYLRQHAGNPIEWQPWDEASLAQAQAEDKPIFLSIGYSACHWCHVMAHESFEDPEIARLLNERFVSIKVDREELPDVDDTYMAAVQLGTGRGGWPMSVFLMPDKRPFFAGTYFPRDDRGMTPGFATIVRQLGDAWHQARADIEAAAHEYEAALQRHFSRPAPDAALGLGEELLHRAVDALARDFDDVNGGFGGAPKFPPHTALEFLLAYEEAFGDPRAGEMARFTLRKMALGGIHDHVGGGFHRYSTDAQWGLPHFEKMLYDNALLLPLTPKVAGGDGAAAGIVRCLQRDLKVGRLFGAALDADSEGEEGAFYLWTKDEIDAVLGDRSGAFAKAFSVAPDGNYLDEATHERTGKNLLYLAEPIGPDVAGALPLLEAARETRVKPGLDEKALVGWNALAAIGLLAVGHEALANDVLGALWEERAGLGYVPRQAGVPAPGYLEDVGAFALALARSGRYEQASVVVDELLDRFHDPVNGGFFATSRDHEALFGRPKPVFDAPIPSGNALAIRALIAVGRFEEAESALASLAGWMERVPTGTEALHTALLELLGARTGLSLAPTFALEQHGIGHRLRIEVPEGQYLSEVAVNGIASPEPRFAGHLELNVEELGDRQGVEVRYSLCTATVCLPPQSIWVPLSRARD